MFGELAGGISDGLRGAGYLARHPRLWLYALAPGAVAVLLLVVTIGWIVGLLSGPIAALAAWLPGSWWDNVMELLVTVVLVFASFSIFVAVASLIAGPFNEMLSESIEEKETGVPSPKFRLWRFLGDVAIGVVHAIRRVFVYALVMGTLLIIGLVVPVIGTLVAAVGGTLATARFAAYDAYDAIWARRRWSYAQKVNYQRSNPWRTLGLGGVVAGMLVVPGLNVICLAIGATAATLRVVDQLSSARDGRGSAAATDRAGDDPKRAG